MSVSSNSSLHALKPTENFGPVKAIHLCPPLVPTIVSSATTIAGATAVFPRSTGPFRASSQSQTANGKCQKCLGPVLCIEANTYPPHILDLQYPIIPFVIYPQELINLLFPCY